MQEENVFILWIKCYIELIANRTLKKIWIYFINLRKKKKKR